MKQIKLSQGRVALVDDEDFGWLSQWKWYYCRSKRSKTGYAWRRAFCLWRTIQMHAAIAERYGFSGQGVEHITACGCDNRKANLQPATRNVRLQTSRGVTWDKNRNEWRVQIKVGRKTRTLGYFEKFDIAVEVHFQVEANYFGQFHHSPTNVCPLGYTGKCPECATRLKALRNA